MYTCNVCLSTRAACDDENFVDLVNGLASASMVCIPIGCFWDGKLSSCFAALMVTGFSWVLESVPHTGAQCAARVVDVLLGHPGCVFNDADANFCNKIADREADGLECF